MCMFCTRQSSVVLRCCGFCFFQAEDGIRDLVRSRGLGDVYKRQDLFLGVESQHMQIIAHPEVEREGAARALADRQLLSLIHI